jgi:hypothetical protein
MHEIRQESECPEGYISITDFAKLAGMRRDKVAKDLANGHFPLDRACSIPWKGRHGRAICLDSSYLPGYVDLRGSKSKPTPKAKSSQAKPTPKAKSSRASRTAAGIAALPKSRSAATRFTKPVTSKPTAPEDPPPHEKIKNTSELVDIPVNLDTENEHSKAYWQIQHTRIKAMREALELQKSRNEVLSVGQAADTLQQILLVIKQTLLAIPGRAAPALSGESNVIKIRNYLETEIKGALKELSKADKYQLRKG